MDQVNTHTFIYVHIISRKWNLFTYSHYSKHLTKFFNLIFTLVLVRYHYIWKNISSANISHVNSINTNGVIASAPQYILALFALLVGNKNCKPFGIFGHHFSEISPITQIIKLSVTHTKHYNISVYVCDKSIKITLSRDYVGHINWLYLTFLKEPFPTKIVSAFSLIHFVPRFVLV